MKIGPLLLRWCSPLAEDLGTTYPFSCRDFNLLQGFGPITRTLAVIQCLGSICSWSSRDPLPFISSRVSTSRRSSKDRLPFIPTRVSTSGRSSRDYLSIPARVLISCRSPKDCLPSLLQTFQLPLEFQEPFTQTPTRLSSSCRNPGTAYTHFYQGFNFLQEFLLQMQVGFVCGMGKGSMHAVEQSSYSSYFPDRNKTYAHTLVFHKKESVSMQ